MGGKLPTTVILGSLNLCIFGERGELLVIFGGVGVSKICNALLGGRFNYGLEELLVITFLFSILSAGNVCI